MKTPNFLIIGAARSGTTTLVHCLDFHPQIFFPKTDYEPKFFSREQEYKRGIEYYLDTYFSSADTYHAVGEKSTEYMENSSVAKRVYHFKHDMKCIALLRNPIERMISNYWWSVHNALEIRDINNAIKTEFENYLKNPEPVVSISSTRPHAYIDRSLYYDNLLPFYRLFAEENIKCFLFEEFIKNMKETIEILFKFLDVQEIEVSVASVRKQRSVERIHSLDPQLYKELTHFFYDKNKKLPQLTGLNIDWWWNEK